MSKIVINYSIYIGLAILPFVLVVRLRQDSARLKWCVLSSVIKHRLNALLLQSFLVRMTTKERQSKTYMNTFLVILPELFAFVGNRLSFEKFLLACYGPHRKRKDTLTLRIPLIKTIVVFSLCLCTLWRKASRHDVSHTSRTGDD